MQVAEQKLEPVGHALVVDSQAHGGKQFHPLDEHLADGLLAELQKYFRVYLVEVGRRYQGQ